MIASIVKLLPFLQMLLEAFKPGEGEQVSRAGKIATLIIVALIAFSSYVSYAYVVQYHALISVQSHDQYLDLSYKELKEKASKLSEDNAKLYDRLFVCLGQRPPYEGDQTKGHDEKKPEAPVTTTVPETPVHAATTPAKKEQAAQRPVGVQDANEFRQEILKTLNQ